MILNSTANEADQVGIEVRYEHLSFNDPKEITVNLSFDNNVVLSPQQKVEGISIKVGDGGNKGFFLARKQALKPVHVFGSAPHFYVNSLEIPPAPTPTPLAPTPTPTEFVRLTYLFQVG